jgi:DNA-directed RNA polymerase subunit N (RpoN/RPB10)
MRRKTYGAYKTDICVMCGAPAYTKNKAKLPACKSHKDTEYPELKCFCGSWVDIQTGKYGAYARCLTCGNLNLHKLIEYNQQLPKEQSQTVKEVKKKEAFSKEEKKALDNYDIPIFD